MKKYAPVIAFTLVFALFFGIVLTISISDRKVVGPTNAGISVVVYGNSTARWKNFELGISHACTQLGIERPVLLLSPSGDAPAQIQLLERELHNGAKGFIVAPVSSEALRAPLEEIAQTLPVVLADNAAGSLLPLVAPDNAALAQELADYVAGTGGRVVVLEHNTQQDNVRMRLDAFLARCEALGLTPERLDATQPGVALDRTIAAGLAQAQPDIFVVLDNNDLETAIDAVPAAMVDVQVCGIGTSEKVVHALDTNAISCLGVANEYAMGYLAAMQLAAALKLTASVPQENIQHSIVTRQTMYQPQIERLLFPAIQ